MVGQGATKKVVIYFMDTQEVITYYCESVLITNGVVRLANARHELGGPNDRTDLAMPMSRIRYVMTKPGDLHIG